jgi:GNAT superfamily N-acetyltransferase
LSSQDYTPPDAKDTEKPDEGATAAPRCHVRAAAPEDANAIAGLAQELLAFYGLPKPYQKSYMAHAIANQAMATDSGLMILVCEDRTGLLGFLAYAPVYALAKCRKSFFIQDIFVSRKARGTGAGRALMLALFERADAAGVGQIDWTADIWNEAAARFYDSFGPMLTTDKRFHRLTEDKFMRYINNYLSLYFYLV